MCKIDEIKIGTDPIENGIIDYEWVEEYNRHMKWFIPTWNKLVEEWNKIIVTHKRRENDA